MRIIIFNYSSSGLFHYAASLINELSRIPNTEILFFTSKNNNLELINEAENVEIVAQDAPHELPSFFRWCMNFKQQREIFEKVKKFNPDVIHISDSYAIYVPHWVWLKKYKIVFTQHDPVSHKGDVYRISSKLIHATQQNLANNIVVHGESLKQALSKKVKIPPENISVIPHGEFPFFLKWKKEDTKEIPNSVLFFGRIVDYKGLDDLIESIIILQKEIPITLIVAGGGDLKKYQPRIDRIKDKKIFNSFIPDDEVIKYFQMSSIVALPYHEASQSGILAIAMPAGKPIIATRVGAIQEIIKDRENGLLVGPNNPQNLAAGIKELLLNKDLREKLAAKAKKTANEEISWKDTANQYYQLYTEQL